jgi:MFS transporter, AAHS family, 4-hydroxybenzoate transporter
MAQSLDVTEIIDRQPVSRFLLGVLFVCTLVTLADGYNISVVAFAAPGIAKAWHIPRAALGPLFSSSLFAGLIGPFLFGVIGDRIGRRNAMILSVLSIGVFGVVSGYCTSLNALIVTRFIAGIGMSGALAVTVAAVNEFAPRRLRATFVTIVFSGTTIGSGLPGLVAPVLLVHHTWPSLFLLGGAVPIVLALGVYLFVPETPKFLCLRSARHAELGRLLQRLEPSLAIPTPVSYALSGETASNRFVLTQLFVGKLAILTPLLWFGSFVAQLTFHSLNTWMPTLLPDVGMTQAQAAHAVVLFQFAGTMGGWVIARPLDRLGMLPCTILYILSIPIVLTLGLPGHTEAMLMLLISAAGFCILGLHFAQVSCVSSVYPTSVRAFGVGWFMLFARAGGAIGPLIVGALVGAHVSLNTMFYWAALPLGLGTLASIAVTLLYQANYHKRHRMPTPFPVPLDVTRT